MLERSKDWFAAQISRTLHLQAWQVFNTINLMDGGATIPFLARYRKEMTGGLDEVALASIRDNYLALQELEKRRDFILASMKELNVLTPDLENQVNKAGTLTELEDIYLPYKPKRRTRATIAREHGLEPLATMIMKQMPIDPEEKAKEFIDPEKSVNSIDEALAGARDIIAEWVSEDKTARERMRIVFTREATISSKPVKGKELEGILYQNYYDVRENLLKAPSHRILAMFRGEEEGFLRLSIDPEETTPIETLRRIFIKSENKAGQQVMMALTDSYKRLLKPSIENEMRQIVKRKSRSGGYKGICSEPPATSSSSASWPKDGSCY